MQETFDAKPKTEAVVKTREEWRERILMSLGGSGWNVELDEKMIDHAIWETLALFTKYTPVINELALGTASKANMVYELKDKIADGTNVVSVGFQLNTIKFFRPYYYPFLNEYYGLRQPRRIAQLFQAHDRYQSFLGTQPSWRWDKPTKRLIVSVEAPITGVNVSALVAAPVTLDDIPYHREIDFLNGAVGFAKLILARVLGKFGAIPSAQGSIDLDHNDLKQEGKEAVEKLESLLARSLKGKPGVGFIH